MTHEFVHVFKGFGRVPSSCLVKMLSDDGETMICFIDLNDGTSVTNASEQLASEIVNEYNLDPYDCRFFETYQQYNYDSFDEIEYRWTDKHNKWEAKEPEWRPADYYFKQLFTES
jgi:hypothetical protein